jgi:predicted DNA-binding transcriptional regulator YafY
MLETSARLLRLLTLLQGRSWVGAELARRLEVTGRTLRRDVDRLRRLGYQVQATVGTGGGYRLGAGSSLPPLLLDNDEAVAVVLGLRTSAAGTESQVEEASGRALAKLEQVMPTRLRRRIAALHASIVPITQPTARVSARALTTIAQACHEHVRLSFTYRGHGGQVSRREAEPQTLVHTGRRWYLVAWDLQRRDWRTFRVDRLTSVEATEHRFLPRPGPDPDIGGYVSRGASVAPYPVRARLLLHAPIEAAADAVPPEIGHLEAISPTRCLLTIGSRSLEELAVWSGLIGFDFEVQEPPELIPLLRRLAARYQRAVAAGTLGAR